MFLRWLLVRTCRHGEGACNERQQRYNEILREEALAYNSDANGLNPRLIEVTADPGHRVRIPVASL